MTEKEFIDFCISKNIGHLAKIFFASNICIPKGDNRHPYADILHEWIEGAEMECGFTPNREVYAKHKDAVTYLDEELYRIKPSEPVYEYKCQFFYGHDSMTTDFYFTEDESNDKNYKIIVATKKERI